MCRDRNFFIESHDHSTLKERDKKNDLPNDEPGRSLRRFQWFDMSKGRSLAELV
ncbi:MAG: hypothetical protein ACI8ZB_004359 [Desulforhopalus sp.]|jgi:hypothetical protein